MNCETKKILMVATGRKTRGGITAVIKAYEQTDLWDKYHCHWVQTHRDGSTMRKICYLLGAWLDYLIRIPFYDIVHLHFSLPNSARRKYPFFRLAKISGKKIVVHLHCGDQLPEIWNSTYEKMFSQADKVLLLSENIKKAVSNIVGIRNNLKVLYNPCPSVNEITPFMKRKKEILVAGTVNRNKGYEDIIKAWAMVAPRYPDWKIVFAGNGELENARTIARNNKVDGQVVFLGWVNNKSKADAFHRASALCMASYAEGFPMAVLDAFSYGLPVISSYAGGIGDVAKNGENMLVFNAGDIEGLAHHMETIVSDSNLRFSLAEASLRLSSTTFNVNTIVEQLSYIYSTL